MDSETVDLIATDPPFKKGRDFHATPGSLAAGASFKDRWTWDNDVQQDWVDKISDDWPAIKELVESAEATYGEDMAAFLVWMGIRLLEMERVLKPIGSIYLHCDQTASHYLKMLMDTIFGRPNFRTEIVWLRTRGAKKSQHVPKTWGKSHDSILFYAKSRDVRVTPYRALSDTEMAKKFIHVSEDGRRYFTSGLSLFRRPAHGPRPNLCYEWRGCRNPHPSGWCLSRDRLEQEYQKGNVVVRPDGKLERRKYEEDYPGVPAGNVWTDIPNLTGTMPEKVSYPTQKPLKLYRRIIRASSKPGDMVLDPFCGCATTCVAAEKEDREWTGIDIWEEAHQTVLDRLHKEGLSIMGDHGPRLFSHGDVTYSTDVPERTDGGEIAAPKIKRKRNLYTPPEPPDGYTNAQRKAKLIDVCGLVCAGCDRRFDFPEYLQLDHNIPRSEGGSNNLTNRLLLCGPCNRRKSNTLTLTGLRRRNQREGFMA